MRRRCNASRFEMAWQQKHEAARQRDKAAVLSLRSIDLKESKMVSSTGFYFLLFVNSLSLLQTSYESYYCKINSNFLRPTSFPDGHSDFDPSSSSTQKTVVVIIIHSPERKLVVSENLSPLSLEALSQGSECVHNI